MLDQIVHFIEIQINWLEVGSNYQFPIYLYDSKLKKRFLAYVTDAVLSQGVYDELFSYQNKGAIIQIPREYFNELILVIEKYEDQFNKLNEKKFNIEQEYLERHFDGPLEKINIRDYLKKSLDSNDFTDIITYVKNQMIFFDPFCNEEVSTLWKDAPRLFSKDNFLNRQVAIGFLLAQSLGYEQKQLASIVFAIWFKNLGLSQINESMIHNKSDEYIKYPYYTTYVLSKQSFEFSHLTKRLILEHCERMDGSGFPRGKKDSYIHPLSSIVAIVDEISHALKKSIYSELKSFTLKCDKNKFLIEAIAKLDSWL